VQRGTTSAELAADLARGHTLPAEWYCDPGRLRLEQERIFARSWQYAGRADKVRRPGDVFATRAGHIPIAVVRDEHGSLRAFVNVCRHRGHEVVAGEGNRRTLQCPYHAWTYGLDGCLRAAPRSDREPGFSMEELSLLPVAVDTWGPFVFVNPGSQASPLAETLGELPEIVAGSGLRLDELEHDTRREWALESNWKVVVENYLECYHCPVAHPSFADVLNVDEDEYRLEVREWVCSQRTGLRRTVLDGGGGPYDGRGEVREAQYHFVWPNLTINVGPGSPNLSVDVWWPDGPQRTAGFTDYFFGRDVPQATRDAIMAFSARVALEDAALVASVQRGLGSGMLARGRLLLGSERLIARFQELVLRALA